MKNKKYLLLAATAALFAACSSDDANVATQEKAPAQQQEVGFSAYVNRGTTRSGQNYELTTANLETSGFGVFAYYTDNIPYSETSIPNFMYNQKVSGAGWTYSPVKYWPNEFGADAQSDGEDRLTFFAYAPYVTVIPATGRIDQTVHTANDALTSGIVGLSSNTVTGDPYVKYYVDFNPGNRVDLCWGVANAVFNTDVTGGSLNAIAEDAPYIDVIKPEIDSKISFKFLHALASLNVKIDADVDRVSNVHALDVDGNTRIYVRSVTFEGFATKGLLNLNASASEGPLWYELNSANNRLGSGVTTIYDGRRDGKEGLATAKATYETPNNLNSVIIQSDAHTTAGVTKNPVNLFASTSADAPVFVIPTEENLTITIVYDVETVDSKVSTYLSDGKTKGSTVENKITKEIFTSKIDAGKQYTINLHLGMTSVKFEATVEDWDDTVAAEDVDLPINGGTNP